MLNDAPPPSLNDALLTSSIIDSSIIFAVLKDERIDLSAASLIDGGVMSSVNVAEVYTKLSDYKFISVPQVDSLLGTLGRIEPFTAAQARICGFLRESTRHLGLSLGDRACIAVGIETGATVYTAEATWAKMDFGCKVVVLR